MSANIEHLRAVGRAATEGPWVAVEGGVRGNERRNWVASTHGCINAEGNEAFIATARNEWDGLLDEVEAARRDMSATRSALIARAERAEAKVARVGAILAAWEAWDGSPGPDGRTHPDASSPHDRDRLRAALADQSAQDDTTGAQRGAQGIEGGKA